MFLYVRLDSLLLQNSRSSTCLDLLALVCVRLHCDSSVIVASACGQVQALGRLHAMLAPAHVVKCSACVA
jgi:hypothetical protein